MQTDAQIGPPMLKVAAAFAFFTWRAGGTLPSSCHADQPIIATPNDQVLHPGGPDIVTQLKGLPAAMFEQAKAFFTNGGK